VLRHLGVQEASTLSSLEHDWAEAVGPSVAAHAVAVTFRHRRLTVRVDDPAWGSQLRWMENDLVERLRRRAEYESLEGLDIRVGPPSR
jgi:predicted nucleic acid-binding Zn ribbon protein